jgi:hypothetical protein
VLDYAVEKCLDKDGNQRCTKPFLVKKSTCYNIKWSTDGALSHTTAEVRDAGSNEIVFYRDTDGEWTPDKGEVRDFLGRPALNAHSPLFATTAPTLCVCVTVGMPDA